MRRLKYLDRKKVRRGVRGSPARTTHIVPRGLIPLHPFVSVPASCRDVIQELDRACRELAECGSLPITSDRLWQQCARTLPNELSILATAQNGRPSHDPNRTALEARATERYALELQNACHDSCGFKSWLATVAEACGVRAPAIRTSSARLVDDGNGIAISFPPAEFVHVRLSELAAFILEGSGPACYQALVAQLALLNLHPFVDGNGRTSRVLVNSILRWSYPGFYAYIPVYEQRLHAPFAFEIALRSAEIHGEWQMLATFYKQLVLNMKACSRAATSHG